MTAAEAFAATFQNLKPEARTAWLDDMCASDHTRLCLGFTANRMAGTPVGDWLCDALRARYAP